MQGNLFANLESQFHYASEEELAETAHSALLEVFDGLPAFSPQGLANIAILGARLGVGSGHRLNAKERARVQQPYTRRYGAL